LIELLAWSHVNQVMAKGTNVVMYQGRQHGQDYELKEIINSFYQTPLTEQIEANFDEPPVPRHVSLYINVFVDPMSHYTRRGIHKISNRTDSLGYSALKENLVLTIDQMVFNSWREVLVNRYEGQNALLRVIEDYLMSYPPNCTQAPPQLKVYCYCATRPKAIAERVEKVMSEVRDCFYGAKANQRRRYILQISSVYHLIQFSDGRPVIYHYDKPLQLFKQLSKPQSVYSQIMLDSHALRGSVIKMICESGRPDALQVYYLKQEKQAQIYVIDERGSLIQWRTPIYNEAALINPLNHFLRQVEYRQNRYRYGENETVQQRQIEYFEIMLPTKETPLTMRPIRPKEGLGQGRYFDVHAQVDFDANDKIGFILQCDQDDFSQMEYGDQVYKALVRHLVNLRQHNKPYPVYITDIAISDRLHTRNGNKVLQTCSYLDYKYKLEQRLNQALIELYPQDNNANS
jgi:adenylate cyclase class 1